MVFVGGIYGEAELVRIKDSGGESVPAFTVSVDGPEELQFLVAAVRKHKGRHDYHGNYYDEF